MLLGILSWFLSGFWHAVAGLVLLAGLFLGSVLILAKAVVQGSDHEWRKCECADCFRRRQRAFQKRHPDWNTNYAHGRTDFISTYQLKPRMIVEGSKGTSFLVVRKIPNSDGFMVEIQNMETKNKSQVFVLYGKACERKQWKVASWLRG